MIAWFLILPSFLFLFVFTIIPIFTSMITSLFNDNLTTLTPKFIGLSNYKSLFLDKIFWECFWNNVLIAITTVPCSIALAIGMALFEKTIKYGKTIIRIGFIYPVFIPMVAAANIWMFIYTPIYGLLGYLFPNARILGNPNTAIWGIIVMLIWKQAGYLMLFYMAGLNGISKELLEASRIDGANKLQMFFKVIWPLLKPTTIYVFIIALTNAYKMVDHLYIMTKGGPGNSTNVLLYYIYQTGFDLWNNGKASAITVILVGFLLLITVIQFFVEVIKAYYN